MTFRLADSLPRDVLVKMEARRAERLQRLAVQRRALEQGVTKQAPEDSEEDINRAFYREVERYLDVGAGECHLAKQEFAELVANGIRFFEGQRYRLSAWVIMPNHVHVVVWPMPNHLLSDILRTWKGFTARQANRRLNRIGKPFWQPESFDHWIRNEEEKARICGYVINNPVKARLCKNPQDWRWSSASPTSSREPSA